jgi:hypothetical protein
VEFAFRETAQQTDLLHLGFTGTTGVRDGAFGFSSMRSFFSLARQT